MEGRMTVCNLSIEMGARGGMIAPDAKILCTLSPAISPASLVACLCASLKYAGTVTTASLNTKSEYF